MKRLSLFLILGMIQANSLAASPNTLEVKKRSEHEIKQIVESVLNEYCQDQCKVINVSAEVDRAIQEEGAPGFDEQVGTITLAPASGKVDLLMDKFLSETRRKQILEMVSKSLKTLDYSVEVVSEFSEFPQSVSASYRVAELRERVTKEVKSSLQSMISQFCGDLCALGDFELKTDVVSSDEVNYGSSQNYYQEGSAAIKVRGVSAVIMIDPSLPKEQADGIVQMAKIKLGQFKSPEVTSEVVQFPKNAVLQGKNGIMNGNGVAGLGSESKQDSKTNSLLDSKSDSKTDAKYDSKSDSKTDSRYDTKEQRKSSDERNESLKKTEAEKINNTSSENKSEKYERFEKIERVENGDAVQQVLEKFRVYGIIVTAIMLALLFSLVAISFRRTHAPAARSAEGGYKPTDENHQHKHSSSGDLSGLTTDEKSSLIGKRIEVDRIHTELTNIFSEQPKVAKYVFTHVLTEEGVETTAQYLELFGESVIIDLLRDPGLQSDLSELMDFYSKNTFDINDEEKLVLLKKLHHRTVTAKMQVHGSRSAVLFDFLADMDTPQIMEMIKNESNTVKAIVLTQCDQKKRQGIFVAHDDGSRIKLMTELSRIDHLPKNYIFNVASALRRKKAENPKLNTEALPGTDVLVSFLEKSNVDTQRTIIHQLMSSAGGDVLNNLKSKLASAETLRFIRDMQLKEVVTHVKHEELLQFLQGCSKEVREAVLSKVSQDLSAELSEGLSLSESVNRDSYIAVERKIINRLKVLANQGMISLTEVNERMFAEEFGFNQTRSDESDFEFGKVG